MSESFTPDLSLSKFEQGDHPGADRLNANWDKLDIANIGHGDEFPETYIEGKIFFNTADGVFYENTGTQETPAWTARSITDAILKDGSVAMEAPLDMGSEKIVEVANGEDPTDGVNRGQLDAAIAAVSGTLGVRKGCKVTLDGDIQPNSGDYHIQWDAEVWDDDDMHDNVTNNHLIEIKQDGRYLVILEVTTDQVSGGHSTYIQIDSTNNVGHGQGIADGSGTYYSSSVAVLLDLVEGQTIEGGVKTVNNGPTFLVKDYNNHITSLAVELIAPNAVGGGDLKSDGSVPMTDPFDNGGNQSKNAADATDPTDFTTLQQVEELIDEVEVSAGGMTVVTNGVLVSGEGNTTSTTFVDVVGSVTLFTLTEERWVRIVATFTVDMDGTYSGANPAFALRVNSTDYPKGKMINSPWNLNTRQLFTVTVEHFVLLAAGDHSARLRLKTATAGKTADLKSDADAPTQLWVHY